MAIEVLARQRRALEDVEKVLTGLTTHIVERADGAVFAGQRPSGASS
jgi:hypothetical protein